MKKYMRIVLVGLLMGASEVVRAYLVALLRLFQGFTSVWLMALRG